MTRRLHALVLVLVAIPGLLVRPAAIVVHEHDGGSKPHHHADRSLVGYVAHSHPHGDDVQESEPATEEEPSDDGVPSDEERHGHLRAGQVVAALRTTNGDEGDSRPAARVFRRFALPAFEQPAIVAFGPPPSPGDTRGHPTSRTGRTIDRLVQGIGLRI